VACFARSADHFWKYDESAWTRVPYDVAGLNRAVDRKRSLHISSVDGPYLLIISDDFCQFIMGKECGGIRCVVQCRCLIVVKAGDLEGWKLGRMGVRQYGLAR
jgi:hypothetical protein